MWKELEHPYSMGPIIAQSMELELCLRGKKREDLNSENRLSSTIGEKYHQPAQQKKIPAFPKKHIHHPVLYISPLSYPFHRTFTIGVQSTSSLPRASKIHKANLLESMLCSRKFPERYKPETKMPARSRSGIVMLS